MSTVPTLTNLVPQEFAPQFIGYLLYMFILFPLMMVFMILPITFILPMVAMSKTFSSIAEGLAT
ncbi:MAG: hypothetical protein QW215_03215 [Ignisphaera sp.]